MSYKILGEAEYTERLKDVISWAKTSLQTLEIDDEKITEQIALVGRLNARVLQDEAEIKNRLELLEATKRSDFRAARASVGEKVTEKLLDDLVTMESDVQEMRSLFRTMQHRVHVMEGLFMSISMSKRMFIERNKQKLNHIYSKGEE